MAKQLITVILLLAFLGQTFNRAVIITSYYTNTSSYAKNCINKAKPKMHCNGKCQMMKKLKQEENKDKQNGNQRNDSKDEVWYFLAQEHPTVRYYQIITFFPVIYKARYTNGFQVKQFQPPRLV